ncbi:pyridoxamine 5'-phosphate oxidase family protein [Deinococcus pimensis]|uniref:pyridoxamine 5'-phosphate oxidase family protein n=1 Tax=Deinococcus pimensis TaxID=309888 RepID=UPI000484C56B|nr:pyridoxamine 5'-phosphate oxidase family protein [Deinococcus pimensis]
MSERPSYYDPAVTPLTRQRRPANRRDDDWVRAFLARATVAHVATRWDDQPFVTPTTFWYDAERHELTFHSNVVGRVRANSERHDAVCVEVSEFGHLLPSNDAIEMSIQYRSVMVFGRARLLTDPDEARRALTGLVGKYFPDLRVGEEIRPIPDEHLRLTSVYAVAVDAWSGKENWKDAADQTDAWPPLPRPDSRPIPHPGGTVD